ncbi:hypothetical protein [Leptospira sp. GIMC2001]|uniref:hypothetical protein n=1 Tax=Leptospira sp. GIMC2001 TaxID=1513297 RepID=UPI00234A1602|nr:hypothetical protein [Leptospira sp. GIMC2001]WCL48856.1 hypothetical protein O4O04_16350 [Leptospira sp. GIMC2001]
MAEENRRSVLADILKRERLDRFLKKEKKTDISKATGLIKEKSGDKPFDPKEASKGKPGKMDSNFELAVKEVAVDIRYYFLTEGEYTAKFRELYNELREDLNRYGITAKKFIDYSRESFDRYKNIQKMMPLEPMKLKGFKYVESSVRDLVKMMGQKFGK